MSEKFTKGPWLQGDSTERAPHCIDAIRNADGRIFELCSIWGVRRYHEDEDCEESEANAHLIAAAPDMYKEIKQDIKWLERMKSLFVIGSTGFRSCCLRIETKKELLAKARGEA